MRARRAHKYADIDHHDCLDLPFRYTKLNLCLNRREHWVSNLFILRKSEFIQSNGLVGMLVILIVAEI